MRKCLNQNKGMSCLEQGQAINLMQNQVTMNIVKNYFRFGSNLFLLMEAFVCKF